MASLASVGEVSEVSTGERGREKSLVDELEHAVNFDGGVKMTGAEDVPAEGAVDANQKRRLSVRLEAEFRAERAALAAALNKLEVSSPEAILLATGTSSNLPRENPLAPIFMTSVSPPPHVLKACLY